ncbi:MAG: GNAT family N-acetyltransferase, partial [Pseudomonadota bacterium]|nr:GNAT family N-acetyltransferase [Pseudomonadota bacterium]
MQIRPPKPRSFEVCVQDSLNAVDAHEWNQLGGYDEPFLSHEFLVALERQGCLGKALGWHPCYLLVRDARGTLVGAMPMYIKTNSYGEFVFDWSWASAYERHGLDYYPKLVVSVPYTPITGMRLLIYPAGDAGAIKNMLIEQAIELAKDYGFTGVHWLFINDDDTQRLQAHGLMMRLGCQYHWHNNNYRDFHDFLTSFQ